MMSCTTAHVTVQSALPTMLLSFSHSVVSNSLWPMDCSMPCFPVFHHLLELAQTHVHWVSDAIQPSHPLSSPSPFAFYLSQHQGFFQWVGSSNQVAKVLELQIRVSWVCTNNKTHVGQKTFQSLNCVHCVNISLDAVFEHDIKYLKGRNACTFWVCIQGGYKRVWKPVELLQLNGAGCVSRLRERRRRKP